MDIAIITDSFPYPPGEQFIETEINHWSNTKFNKVYLLPTRANGNERLTPNNITVDLFLSRPNSAKCVISQIFSALFSRIFFLEIIYLIKNKKLTIKTSFIALKAIINVKKIESSLSKWVNRNPSIKTIYTYWNESATYAACELKEKGLLKKVVSRAHGYDVYEERRINNYMPLKQYYSQKMDCVFVLSEKSMIYMKNRYGFPTEKLLVSRLGVKVQPETSVANSNNYFHIVSVSFCVEIKRIDKIIQGIRYLALQQPGLWIKWTHIGDGPLRSDLESISNTAFDSVTNVEYKFKGHISNDEVNRFYTEEKVDCFINASESEGVPVSIMEAMAAGVPAIGPDIGGISELITTKNGLLMSENPSTEEIAKALKIMSLNSKNLNLRHRAREKILNDFNAEKNYPEFIKAIEKINIDTNIKYE